MRSSAARRGVGVTVICPGFVHSRITAANPFPMPFIMQAETRGGWADAVATLDMSPDDPTNGHEHARQLYGVLNRIGEVHVGRKRCEQIDHRRGVVAEHLAPHRQRIG